MKDSDQAIEKVLAGLRDAEAPTGMERRILDGVQHRAASGIRQNWLTGLVSRIAVRPMVYATTLAGIVTIALAIPIAIHQRVQVPVQSAKAVPSKPLPPASSSAKIDNAKSKGSVEMVQVSRKKKAARAVEVLDDEDSLAVREMNAPSHPAPPLPLTEQEKLLVRFVRTSSPEQLAANDPAKWAAHDAQEQAEFDRFFGLFTKEQAAKQHQAKEKPVEEALNKS